MGFACEAVQRPPEGLTRGGVVVLGILGSLMPPGHVEVGELDLKVRLGCFGLHYWDCLSDLTCLAHVGEMTAFLNLLLAFVAEAVI